MVINCQMKCNVRDDDYEEHKGDKKRSCGSGVEKRITSSQLQVGFM